MKFLLVETSCSPFGDVSTPETARNRTSDCYSVHADFRVSLSALHESQEPVQQAGMCCGHRRPSRPAEVAIDNEPFVGEERPGLPSHRLVSWSVFLLLNVCFDAFRDSVHYIGPCTVGDAFQRARVSLLGRMESLSRIKHVVVDYADFVEMPFDAEIQISVHI